MLILPYLLYQIEVIIFLRDKTSVRVKDEFDTVGNWSFFEIEIPRIRIVFYLWFEWLLERSPLLEKLLGLIRLG